MYKIINYDKFKISENEKIQNAIKEYIVESCLEIANSAQFPTDYNDVKDHLFEDDSYIRMFIVEEKENQVIPNIKGFLISALFKGYNDNTILHCHGIILHPDIQGLGLSKALVAEAIKMTNPNILTAKTHNPRCFNSFANCYKLIAYYPNEYNVLDDDIRKVAASDPFISVVNDDLVYKNAYPDEKIQQTNRNNGVKSIFQKLDSTDAQAIVVILDDSKLNIEQGIKRTRKLI